MKNNRALLRWPFRSRPSHSAPNHGKPAARKLRFEPLELRTLLTTMLYLDYGDNFTGARGLTLDGVQPVTYKSFVSTVNGPELLDLSDTVPDTTAYTFKPFSSSASQIGFTTEQIASLRAKIDATVQRYYAPFDVTVVDLTGTAGARTLNDIKSRLKNGATYELIAGITPDAGSLDSSYGMAGGDDVESQKNLTADTACVLANSQFFSGGASPALGVDKSSLRLAYTTAHEAGHTFGLRHTNNENKNGATQNAADDLLLTGSDILVKSADEDQRQSFDFFSRFTLDEAPTEKWSPPDNGTENPYNILATNLGVRRDRPAYVTGTGADDLITITKTGADTANVLVQAYRDTALTNPITQQSYSISTASGVLVETGRGDDMVEIDAKLGTTITVHGMGGTDRLLVEGNHLASGTYTPGSTITTSLDGNINYQGTLVVGTTTINFSEYRVSSSVTARNLGALTFTTPNSADWLTVTSPAAGQNQIAAGVSAPTPFVPIRFSDVTTVTMNAFTNDKITANDTITVAEPGIVATGIQNFIINAGRGSDTFDIVPSMTAVTTVNGNAPAVGDPGVPPGGDYLKLGATSSDGHQLTETSPGNGRWTFTDGHKAVKFTSIEKFNHVDIVAVASDAGAASRPVIRVYDAETMQLKFTIHPSPFLYGANYRNGFHVAVGDLNGDGIPDVAVAPGLSMAPSIQVFNGAPVAGVQGQELVGMRIAAASTYGTRFVNGVQLAIGDVNGDGWNDIALVPSRGVASVMVFRNNQGRGFTQYGQTFNAFRDSPRFIGGATVAIADRNADGRADIVVGSGSGMAAIVRVFNMNVAPTAIPAILCTASGPLGSQGGVNVAVGDVDAQAKVLTALGPGGRDNGQIKRFNPLAGHLVDSVFATNPSFSSGGLNLG